MLSSGQLTCFLKDTVEDHGINMDQHYQPRTDDDDDGTVVSKSGMISSKESPIVQ